MYKKWQFYVNTNNCNKKHLQLNKCWWLLFFSARWDSHKMGSVWKLIFDFFGSFSTLNCHFRFFLLKYLRTYGIFSLFSFSQIKHSFAVIDMEFFFCNQYNNANSSSCFNLDFLPVNSTFWQCSVCLKYIFSNMLCAKLLGVICLLIPYYYLILPSLITFSYCLSYFRTLNVLL